MPVAVAASGDTNVVEDLYGILRVLSDGTVVRSPDPPEFCPVTFPCDHPSVQWKEAVYDKGKNLRVRMYKPSGGGEQAGRKLPDPWSETTGELIRLVSVFVVDSCVAVAAPKTA
ncbi:hypothetical protein TRIUR3_30332 [Triticum urartu]|uniref:Uncharacterized protein n=2 Tax=Triticum TaxID=4564 RepID=A0A9R1B2Y5_TRITD|nr:hypothetical protein TRIUR3_30332 [Triticum urartu]VAI49558.1 unnamed protein product [Triticum turgidum subsp. durum]